MGPAKLGLRLRVALALALACLLIVGALGFTLYTASEELEEALIDQIVTEEMEYLLRRHRDNPDFQPQQGSSLQSFIVRDPAGHAQLPPHLFGLAPGEHEFFVGRAEHHALVRESGGTRYIVAYKVGLHEQREQDFKLLVLLSVLTAVLASLALGYWLSGVLVRQVVELADRVGTLRPGQHHVELARPGQDLEVAMLARAFDGYQARIESMIRREQEFTSNASHELRTPLTAIGTSCEILLADPALGEKSRARVEWISAAAARMAQQLQTLLFLARGQELGEIEPVSLAECVAEAVEPHLAEVARTALSLEVDIARDVVLHLNYPALRLVVGNLLRNAIHYTENGFIRVGYAAKRLTVTDSGRGIGAEHVARIFERFYRAEDRADGSGLGLAIVKRICNQYGWKIEVDSAPGQGSTFSITFP